MSGAGTFTVVAGTGNAGSSGDGGPANQAELNDPTGLALASDGTLYIADRGNNRVRALKSDGTIETVAGNGMANPGPIGLGGDATQTAIAEPTAIASAPDGLYIAAANQVLKVGAGGVVSQALGPVQFRGADPRFPQSSECDPSAVAVDAAGDVYVACANTKYLLVRQASGAIRFLGAFAAEKATSTLAQLLDGTVVGVDGGTIIRLSDASRTVAATVGQVGSLSYFEPQGIAGASLQSLYVDQDGASGKGPAAIAQGSLTNLTLRWQTPT